MLVFAVLIFTSLFADLCLKSAADRQQVMWSCYWGAVAVASGILIASDRLVAWGTVFFAGLGLPAWLLGFIFSTRVEATSVLIHTLPLIAGLIYIRSLPALPAWSALGAWLLYVVPFTLSWDITSPGQMINLSHWSRSAMPFLPFQPWQFYMIILPLSLVTVLLADWLISFWLAHRAASRAHAGMRTVGPQPTWQGH